MDIPNTDSVNYAFASAQSQAMQYRHEFITPEHLLSALLEQVPFQKALAECFCTPEELSQSISEYLSKEVERVPQEIEYELEISGQLSELLQYAYMTISHSSAEEMDVPHLVQGMLQLEDSWAGYLLKETVGEDMPEFLSSLISNYEHMNQFQEETSSEQEKSEPWRNYVTCLNEGLQDRNPLIGRNVELERTIQVLCRKEKNNPLHVGEPGVGKTALAYGLAARIEAGNVPERLTGCRIYELDLGNLLAGTQYRGEFEKRLKAIMEGIRKEGHAIVYIDEIHNLIGAGRTGDGSMDASNMLKPYLEGGEIRFIGSTTYEEFNRYFCARLCLLGYVVFSVEYRLVPDCSVYDQFSDVSTAMTFIRDNLSSYEGNPDKIYGVADSGGAYLLTNVAAMTKNKKFAKAAHTKAPDFSLNALGLISGMFYTTRFDKIGLFLPSYLYGKGYKKKAIAPYVNIENPEIVSALPPCFLVTSHSDNLEHYTVKFEKALKANRVSHKLLRFGKNKKLTHAFSVFEPFYEESTKTLKSMHEYFQSF